MHCLNIPVLFPAFVFSLPYSEQLRTSISLNCHAQICLHHSQELHHSFSGNVGYLQNTKEDAWLFKESLHITFKHEFWSSLSMYLYTDAMIKGRVPETLESVKITRSLIKICLAHHLVKQSDRLPRAEPLFWSTSKPPKSAEIPGECEILVSYLNPSFQ